MLDVTVTPLLALLVFIVIVLAASTQDIATDATGIHATNRHNRTLASGASAAGVYLGFVLGSGVWLWVYVSYGWQFAVLLGASTLTLLTVRVFLPEAR